MDYEFVLNYYKSFCTKISDLKKFFGEDSTFFFIGDSGKTFIAYGRDDIQQRIEDQFWIKSPTNADKTLIAYNINIEKKSHMICPNNNVGVVIIATLKGIYYEDDIPLTKTIGRRFAQTFLIRKSGEKCIQWSDFSYLAPTTDLFDRIIRPEVTPPLPLISDDDFDGQLKFTENTNNANDLDFQKIVKNIDKLMDDNNDSNEDLNQTKVNSNELMPISMNEIFDDNSSEEKRQELSQTLTADQYLSDVWNHFKGTENETNSSEEDNNNENIDKSAENKNSETNDDNNCGISFADVLRDNLQSWQTINKEEKPQEIRIITNCSKSKYKHNCLKTNGDRKQDLFGQQNITIMGAQNLEDFSDNQILFVANIPIGYPKSEFKSLFDIYGKVLSMKFIERIGVSFAFIYFESSNCVEEVFKKTTGNNNLSIDKLQLKVDRYRPRIPGYLSSNTSIV